MIARVLISFAAIASMFVLHLVIAWLPMRPAVSKSTREIYFLSVIGQGEAICAGNSQSMWNREFVWLVGRCPSGAQVGATGAKSDPYWTDKSAGMFWRMPVLLDSEEVVAYEVCGWPMRWLGTRWKASANAGSYYPSGLVSFLHGQPQTQAYFHVWYELPCEVHYGYLIVNVILFFCIGTGFYVISRFLMRKYLNATGLGRCKCGYPLSVDSLKRCPECGRSYVQQ